MKKITLFLFIVILSGCAGTYYTVDTDYRPYRDCNTYRHYHYNYCQTNYIIKPNKPYRPYKPFSWHKPTHKPPYTINKKHRK